MRYAWSELYSSLKDCKRCGLHEGRNNVVIGDGNPKAPVMFIGEGPGRDEDLQGLPFVGAAGKLLDKMLDAIGLSRDNAYIANIVKCRPPNNRNPNDDEAAACLPYLRAQVALVRPKVIVCLVRWLLNTYMIPRLRSPATAEYGSEARECISFQPIIRRRF